MPGCRLAFPQLGCVAVWCGAGGPSPVPVACAFRCGAFFRPSWLSVPTSPGGRHHLRWGVVWGLPWVLAPPPFFFACVVGVCSRPPRWGPFVGCRGGVWWCGSRFYCVVVHRWSLSTVPAVVPLVPTLHPPSFVFFRGLCCVCVPLFSVLPLPRRACVLACPGWLFLGPIGGCVVVLGGSRCMVKNEG